MAVPAGRDPPPREKAEPLHLPPAPWQCHRPGHHHAWGGFCHCLCPTDPPAATLGGIRSVLESLCPCLSTPRLSKAREPGAGMGPTPWLLPHGSCGDAGVMLRDPKGCRHNATVARGTPSDAGVMPPWLEGPPVLSALPVLSGAVALCHVPVPFPACGSGGGAPAAAARGRESRRHPAPRPASPRLTWFSGPMAPRYAIAAEFLRELQKRPAVPAPQHAAVGGSPGRTPCAPSPRLDVLNPASCPREKAAGRGSETPLAATPCPQVPPSATPPLPSTPQPPLEQGSRRGEPGLRGGVGALVALGARGGGLSPAPACHGWVRGCAGAARTGTPGSSRQPPAAVTVPLPGTRGRTRRVPPRRGVCPVIAHR